MKSFKHTLYILLYLLPVTIFPSFLVHNGRSTSCILGVTSSTMAPILLHLLNLQQHLFYYFLLDYYVNIFYYRSYPWF